MKITISDGAITETITIEGVTMNKDTTEQLVNDIMQVIENKYEAAKGGMEPVNHLTASEMLESLLQNVKHRVIGVYPFGPVEVTAQSIVEIPGNKYVVTVVEIFETNNQE